MNIIFFFFGLYLFCLYLFLQKRKRIRKKWDIYWESQWGEQWFSCYTGKSQIILMVRYWWLLCVRQVLIINYCQVQVCVSYWSSFCVCLLFCSSSLCLFDSLWCVVHVCLVAWKKNMGSWKVGSSAPYLLSLSGLHFFFLNWKFSWENKQRLFKKWHNLLA